jgi:hypothetical protein
MATATSAKIGYSRTEETARDVNVVLFMITFDYTRPTDGSWYNN